MGAVVATLLDVGWVPLQADRWADDSGKQHVLDYTDPRCKATLKALLKHTINNNLWKRAAEWYQGAGLEDGADLTVPRRVLKRYRKKDPRLAGAIASVLQGAYWTKQRKADAGLGSAVCPRCQAEAETPFHRFWGCCENVNLDDPEVRAADRLCVRAFREIDDVSCFWTRGLPPAAWTYNRAGLHKLDFREYWAEGGRVCGTVNGTEVIFGSDGSGGKHAGDWRLQRCGWGWVALDKRTKLPLAAGRGAVPGAQTVPRAELCALIDLAAYSSGPLFVVVDASYLIKGYQKGKKALQCGPNGDLWFALFRLLGSRTLTLHKVKSHLPASAIGDSVKAWEWIANAYADGLAEDAAKKAQVPDSEASAVAQVDRDTEDVLVRLGKLVLHAAQTSIDKRRVPPAAGPKLPSRTDLQKVALAQGHDLTQDTKFLRCRRCFNRGTWAEARQAAWMFETCTPAQQPNSFNATHKMVRKGISWICAKCGAMSTSGKVLGLAKPCPNKPSARGRANLKDLLGDFRHAM